MVVLHFLGYGWPAGLVLGGALAMSSTAIVSKMLAERMELGTPHGRDIMGILLFQDLAVVAFLIVIPSLGQSGGELASSLAIAALKAAVALAVILFLGQAPMRAWFHLVARQRSSELFVLNVLLVTLGLGAITEALGLSLALGAFLAGMLIAETEYRYQVEEDIKPFRDVLLGLFFIIVGAALDVSVVLDNVAWVAILVVAPVIAKLVLIVLLARIFGAPLSTSLRVGFYLAQAGELALVMLALAVRSDVLPAPLLQPVLAAMIISMCVAPLVIQSAEPIVRKLTANDWLARAAQVTQIAARSMARQDHVIICGYGRSGQNLARLLEAEEIPYVAMDSDPERVREAAADGSNVAYGDASRREVLVSAGLAKARAVAITFANTPVALRILHQLHSSVPSFRSSYARSTTARSTACTSGRDRSRAGGARRQPHAGLALTAAAWRAAEPGAAADSHDPRRALRPVPRILPWRDRLRRWRGEPAIALALPSCSQIGPRRSAHARRSGAGRERRSDGRPPSRCALPAARLGMAFRRWRRRGSAGRPEALAVAEQKLLRA
jgi:CPA2 family monovalent cation:H+ antiporter-2